MAVAGRLFMAAALLLVSLGLLESSPLPACPEPCTCQRAPLLNCSSSGISVVPQHIRDTVTELDLSHNLIDSVTLDRPLHNLRNVWLGNNSITRLSLCMERNLGGRHVGGRYLRFLRPWSGQGCVSWAPSLQLLSVERNQLEQLPEGLEGSESLQILQLSFNKISTLRPGDLSPLRQLIELHLQHNQISSLHPQMFEDLAQLQVLDLSFNKLTSIHPLMYLSLRNIGADVRLSGNQWHCDCSMRSLRRRLVYDSSRGLQTWSVVCSSPSVLSDRDLLQLEEDDLNCFHTKNSPELHRDVTVQSGSDVLLTCSAQDTMWLMPDGHASDSQPEAGLLISDFTEKDTGLYVCVSENQEVVSIFNLQISKMEGTKRKIRSLDSQQIISESILNRMGQPRNETGDSVVSQSKFNLAVCLSVFITFLIAFILGVLLRPCIDNLCRRIIHKKSSTKTHTVSSVEHKQYDNEAYNEDSVEIGNYRERGIDVNIRNDATIRGGAAHTHANGDSSSESSSQHSGPEDQRDGRERSGRPHNTESKHTPNSVRLEERRSSSSSSDSSHYDKVLNHTTPKSPQLVRDSAQQRADDLTARNVLVPQISIEGSKAPGFSSEPFADWSPHKKNLSPTSPDLWRDNGEKFEFSDSPRSVSPRSSSVFDSLNDSKQTAATTLNKKMRDDTSSSSEDELKGRTANSGENRNDTQRHAVRPKHSSSSHSSDSDGKNGRIKQETNKGLEKGKLKSPTVAGEVDTGKKAAPKPRTKWRLPSFGLGFTNQSKSTDTGPSAASPSSTSSESESEAKTKDLQVEKKGGKLSPYPNQHSIPKMGLGIKARSPASKSTSSDESTDDMTKRSKRQEKKDVDKEKSLALKAKSPASGSSSSSDSEDDKPNKMKTLKQAEMNMPKIPTTVPQTKRPPDIKPPSPHSDSSSSSDSEDDTTGRKKMPRPGKVEIKGAPFQGSQTKRPLDIKPPSPHSDSSSTSDSEKETRNQMNKPQKETNMARPPTNAAQINRPPNIKPPSPHSDSSSSSSEDETPNQKTKQEQGKTITAKIPTAVSPTVSHGLQTQRPAINLERPPNIKPPSPHTDSSSSSDSEKEKENQMKTQQQRGTNMAKPPTNATQINRPPNIKAPSPQSDSSSSSSEDETPNQKTKQEQGKTIMAARPPTVVSPNVSHGPQIQWPVINLAHNTIIKKRLDFKVKSPASDSSSSDSEKETTNKMKTQQQRETNMARPLTNATQINRPPNIKPPSPSSDSSSSSSDSENEKENKMKTQQQWGTNIARVPAKVPQTVSHGPQTQWPVINLEHNTRINKRLDFKMKTPASDSSSSSDSEKETPNQMKTQQQREMNMTRPPTNATEINRPPNIKPPSPHTDSSSSSDSEDEKLKGNTIHVSNKLNSPTVAGKADTGKKAAPKPHTKWRLPSFGLGFTNRSKSTDTGPSAASPSSTSSESESEAKTKDLQVEKKGGKLSTNPAVKAKLPASGSSSSSDSEDDKPNKMKTLKQGEMNMPKIPTTVPQTKRPTDIKPPSPQSDSSSSSDSEDDTPNQIKKPQQGESYMARLPTNVSQIKRPPDNKPPSPHSDSSSSSESEAEQTNHSKRESPRLVEVAGPLFQKSPTGSHVSKSQWPAVDFGNITHVKRRLDFKTLSPPPNSSSVGGMIHAVEVKREKATKNSSSSSSSSSDEQEETKKVLSKPSTTVGPNLGSRWPRVNLGSDPHVKSRLDIRAPSPPPGSSSSSSESEGGTPDLSLKAGGDRANFGVTSYQPKITLPDLNLSNRTKRESIASPGSKQSESSSSGSDSEAEKREGDKQRLGSSTLSRPVTTQFSGSSKTSMIHTNQDIKLEKYTVFPDDGDQKLVESFKSTTVVSPELESRWAKMNLNMSRFKKRLEITPRTQKSPGMPSLPTSLSSPTSLTSYSLPSSPSSPKPASSSSSSSSSSSDDDTESKGSKTSYRRKETESSQIFKNRPGNVSLTGNSVEVKHSIKKDHGLPVTQVKSNPNTTLTGFGTSNLRRHLDIKVSEKAPATPPLQQKSDSSSSSEDEDSSTQHAGKGWQGRSQLPAIPDNKASQIQTSPSLHVARIVNIKTDYSQRQTEEEERKTRLELKSQTSRVGGQSDSLKPNMSLPSVSLQRKASSSSSEDEMTGHRVSGLKLGDPSRRKDLNAKEPSTSSSSSSSSSSEDEGHAAKQSKHGTGMLGRTDESVAAYKRSTFKTSSTPSVYYPHNGPSTGLSYRRVGAELVTVAQGSPSQSVRGSNTSPALRSLSFDDVARKKINQSQHTTDMDLPPDIRWTGIGRHLSDVSISTQRRHLDVGLSTLPAEPNLPKLYSSGFSAGKSDSAIKQDRSTLGYKYSSPGNKSVSPASTRAFDQFDFSSGSTSLEAVQEVKREGRGLRALRAMSTERRMWDALDGNLDNTPLLVDISEPQVTTSYSYRRSEDIKPLAKQPLTPLRLSSTSVDERRGTNLSYGVPHYRRHELGGTGAMQSSPPPVPNTPLPDEEEGLTWKSFQSKRSFNSSNPNISSV